MRCCGSILAVVVVLWLVVCSEAKFHVFVINYIGAEADHINLTVSCNHNLGTRVLEFGGAFDWEVKNDGVYRCDMRWGNKNGHFDVFDRKRDSKRCGDGSCYWRVDRDGLYLYIKDRDDYLLQFRWP